MKFGAIFGWQTPKQEVFLSTRTIVLESEITRYLLTSWWWSIFWVDALTSAELLWTVSRSLLTVTTTASIKQRSPRDHRQEAEKLFWCPTTPQTVSHDGKQCSTTQAHFNYSWVTNHLVFINEYLIMWAISNLFHWGLICVTNMKALISPQLWASVNNKCEQTAAWCYFQRRALYLQT